MKLIDLTLELSNRDYDEILEIFTVEELELHLKKYIRDVVLMEKKKEKILDEAERTFAQLRNLK